MNSQRLAVIFATWFFCGHSPVAPGTVGSLCAWAIGWFVVHRFGIPAWAFSLAAIALLPLAVWSAETAASEFESKDPSRVVIDEVVGLWIAIGPVAADSWPQWIAALVLFRLFDISKPFGIRRLEALRGGRGIVADDIGAGACAMIGVFLVRWAGY